MLIGVDSWMVAGIILLITGKRIFEIRFGLYCILYSLYLKQSTSLLPAEWVEILGQMVGNIIKSADIFVCQRSLVLIPVITRMTVVVRDSLFCSCFF